MLNVRQLSLTAAVAVLLGPGNAACQTYPTRPIRLIVPFPPSTGIDVVARFVGQALAERFGQSVIVDNRSGAGGTIGAELGARSTPDGYTLLAISTSNVINVSMYSKLAYDMTRDFAAIVPMASAPNLLAVSPALTVNSVKDLVAIARAKPGQLNFPSSGVGSASHMGGEVFKSMAGVDIVHVPFKGSGPALTSLLANEVQLAFFSIPSTLPHVKTGKLKVLAIGSARRSQLLPDLPTIAESGIPGYEAGTWYGLLAPVQTPQPIIRQLNQEIGRIVQAPELRERLIALGTEPMAGSEEQFGAFIQAEMAKYAKLVKAIGARID